MWGRQTTARGLARSRSSLVAFSATTRPRGHMARPPLIFCLAFEYLCQLLGLMSISIEHVVSVALPPLGGKITALTCSQQRIPSGPENPTLARARGLPVAHVEASSRAMVMACFLMNAPFCDLGDPLGKWHVFGLSEFL